MRAVRKPALYGRQNKPKGTRYSIILRANKPVMSAHKLTVYADKHPLYLPFRSVLLSHALKVKITQDEADAFKNLFLCRYQRFLYKTDIWDKLISLAANTFALSSERSGTRAHYTTKKSG